MNLKNKEQIIIAGPCALESRAHAQLTIEQAKKLGINTVRMNLWKPRTVPGFEGVGKAGVPWVREAAEAELTPAMEVLIPKQVDLLMNKILGQVPHATLLLWIGSRNQNHLDQQGIAKAVSGEKRVKLMIKNQPWRDESHWAGIVEHALFGGASIEQLLLCHRGFAPWDKASCETRNIADLPLALRLKEKTGLPLILDPSHIGGKSSIVKELIRDYSKETQIDGQLIEVHPDPTQARTDAKQQLTWKELEEVLHE